MLLFFTRPSRPTRRHTRAPVTTDIHLSRYLLFLRAPPSSRRHTPIHINPRSRPTGAAKDGWSWSLDHPPFFLLPFRGPLPLLTLLALFRATCRGAGHPKTGPLTWAGPSRRIAPRYALPCLSRHFGTDMDFEPTPRSQPGLN
jgi:hypothetical protein